MTPVATDTGEAEIPIWEAVEATAMGRSGRMFFFTAMSSMIGNIVYTTCPVPHNTVKVQVVSGAKIVTYSGFFRKSFSANCIITSKP